MLGLLNSVIVPWDIMLVSYEAGGKWFNRAFNKAVSKLLQLFSHSVFSHVWVVWLKTDNNGFDRVHSTLDNSWWRSGVKRENLTQYLEKRRPSTILVVRPSYSSEEKKEEFLERAYLHVKNKVEYDTSDAISDITGLTLWRDDTKFNCGELVYDCIRSIIKDFSLEQGSIPVSYLKHELFTPVYLTDI
jgi:transposase